MYVKTFTRHKIGLPFVPNLRTKFGPKSKDHPSIGCLCFLCDLPFKERDYTVLIPLGPGLDKHQRRNIRNSRYFSAIAVEVHYACAGGNDKSKVTYEEHNEINPDPDGVCSIE